MTVCPLIKQTHPLDRSNPERDNPCNAEMAFCFQWHDTIISLYGLSNIKNNDQRRKQFGDALALLKQSIESYKHNVKK